MLRDQYTIRMVAAYWACSTKTVRQLIETGALACVRPGGVIRVTREQVAAYEAAHGAVTAVPQRDLHTRYHVNKRQIGGSFLGALGDYGRAARSVQAALLGLRARDGA